MTTKRGTLRAHRATVGMLLGVAVLAGEPAAGQARSSLLVEPRAMAEAVRGGNAVVFHIGQEDTYAQEHVAGARYLDPWAVLDPKSRGRAAGGLTTELPAPTDLETTLRALGVSDNSQIFIYWADEWYTPTMRVVYTLDWGGLGDRVHVLNGGLPAWKEAGLPLTADETPPATPGHLTVRPRAELVVDAAWVQAHGRDRGIGLVDARHQAAFDGIEEDQGRKGHIEGAHNLPPFGLVGDDQRFKSDAELRALFASAGVTDGDTVVAYCHIGQYATAVLFAARLTGHSVKLYDGSWQDWARRDLPAVGGGS